MQLQCLDYKQTTQETKARTRALNIKANYLFYQLNCKKHQNCRENNVFFSWTESNNQKQDKNKEKQNKTIIENKTNIEIQRQKHIP